MEYVDQPSGDEQPPLSERRSSLPSTSRQEQPGLAPDLRLFKRITILTLFLGILIGMLLAVFGVMTWDYGLIPGAKVTLHLATPAVDGLLVPLSFILLGAIFILRWRLDASYKRLTHFRPVLRRATLPYAPSMWMQASGGLLILFMGCFFLVEKLVDFSIELPILILPICFFAWLIVTCCVDLYLRFQGKRHIRRE